MHPVKVVVLLLMWCSQSEQRIHEYNNLKRDARQQLTLSTFGFLKGGTLIVDVKNFTYRVQPSSSLPNQTTFGFTLDRTTSPGAASYLSTRQEKCALIKPQNHRGKEKDASVEVIFFRFDLKNKKILVEKSSKGLADIQVTQDGNTTRTTNVTKKIKRSKEDKIDDVKDPDLQSELTIHQLAGPTLSYSANFEVHIINETDEGLYNLFFHNCFNYAKNIDSQIDLKISIIEKNGENYLSAGEIPEPVMFFVFSVLYFISGLVWLSILRRSRDSCSVYKLHYLMLAVIWVKSGTCLLHATNQYFIEKNGQHAETWAILYYIAYL